MITAAGLIVYNGDEASRAGAEGVLGGGISDTTGGQWRDGGRGTVGAALYLVEWASVSAVQGTGGAMSGDARCAAGGVNVTWPSSDEGTSGNKA